MSTKLDILRTFKNNLISFLDELIQLFPNDANLVIVRIAVKDNIGITTDKIMEYFISYVLPLKQKILSKEDSFFTEGKSLFGMLPDDKANIIKNAWLYGNLDQTDKDCIWDWAKAFVTIAERYQKIN